MMTEVVIAGIGQTPVGEHWETSLRELAYQALESARQDAGGLRPEVIFVGNMLSPILSRQAQLGALVGDFAGLRGVEATTIEAGGASGAAAFRMGYMAVASGQAEVALVVGVEKSTEQHAAAVEAAYTTNLDVEYEGDQGMTPTTLAALLMNRYLYESGAPRTGMGGFPITAHANARTNPNAMFRSGISEEAYLKAGMVSEPLNLFDVAPTADGAAAVLLTRSDLLPPGFPHPLIRVTGSASSSDTLSLHDRKDLLDFRAARLSVEQACRQAGILPGDVDFFELYDAYSVYAALSLEAAGFAERGQGWRMAAQGALNLDGKLPISTFGGLKARGNPGGATGVYQVVEAALQLRGEAGPNQVTGAQTGMVQALGGAASVAVTHILTRFNP
jgi:acetyl-CoA C-acetyltransferase